MECSWGIKRGNTIIIQLRRQMCDLRMISQFSFTFFAYGKLLKHSLWNQTMTLTTFGSTSANSNTLFLTLPTPPPCFIHNHRTNFMFSSSRLSYGHTHTLYYSHQRSSVPTIVCSASNKQSNSSQIRYTFSLLFLFCEKCFWF